MMGSTGPSPPLLVEPVAALTRLVRGDEPFPLEGADTEEGVPPPALGAAGRGWVGAVACASPAAATPAGPCAASARAVEGATGPLPPPLPPPPPPEPCEPPPTGWTVLVGLLPAAVGIVSSYWLTPELPGGAIV